MEECCHESVCGKCRAWKFLILGIVLYAVTWYAQAQNSVWIIWYAIAVLVLLKGISQLLMPYCPHCKPASKSRK